MSEIEEFQTRAKHAFVIAFIWYQFGFQAVAVGCASYIFSYLFDVSVMIYKAQKENQNDNS